MINEQNNSDPFKNVAFYAFFKLDRELRSLREILLGRMRELEVKGTILLGPEGVNSSLAGITENIDAFLSFLFETLAIPEPELKISYSKDVPFKRSLIKIKPYIVAKPGMTPIQLPKDSAPYISPEEFHQWIMDNKDMVILDTRNDYEYEAGRFKNAQHLGTKHFAHFEENLQNIPQDWADKPIVTFCTGGIRCEKAAPLMIKKGFHQVYQLQGGVLKYLKEIGRGYFEGECFVFDQRRALDEAAVEKEGA